MTTTTDRQVAIFCLLYLQVSVTLSPATTNLILKSSFIILKINYTHLFRTWKKFMGTTRNWKSTHSNESLPSLKHVVYTESSQILDYSACVGDTNSGLVFGRHNKRCRINVYTDFNQLTGRTKRKKTSQIVVWHLARSSQYVEKCRSRQPPGVQAVVASVTQLNSQVLRFVRIAY